MVGWSFASGQTFDSSQREALLRIVREIGRSLIGAPARYLDVG